MIKRIDINLINDDCISFDCQDVLIKDGMLLVIQKEKTLDFNISIVQNFIFAQKEKEGKKND